MPSIASTEAPFTEYVIPQLLAWRRAGEACALVTLVGIEGSSPRRLGSQMAVRADGTYRGFISSGCAEAAIVAEALACIAARAQRTVRYGAGSQYIDVVLPCGSGIDVQFDPLVATGELAAIDAAVMARRPASLRISIPNSPAAERPSAGGWPRSRTSGRAGRHATGLIRRYDPVPRLLIAGRGVAVECLLAQARNLEWQVCVVTPDSHTLERAAHYGAATHHITRPSEFDPTPIDRDTAVVLLFHDHEWEPEILARCAGRPAFYVGALGSRRTHAQRIEFLRMKCTDPGFIEAIRSPVGLDIGAANPPELALAISSEVLACVPRRPLLQADPVAARRVASDAVPG